MVAVVEYYGLIMNNFKAPEKVWISWCKNCGEVVLADKVKAKTRCPYCRYPDDNQIRYTQYVKCSTKCSSVGKTKK